MGKEFMMDRIQEILSRALKGEAETEVEAMIFKDMTAIQKWTVMNAWLKLVYPAQVETKFSGDFKIEVSYSDEVKNSAQFRGISPGLLCVEEEDDSLKTFNDWETTEES